jgi:hypothetical protein
VDGAEVDAKWNPTTGRSIIKFKPVGVLKDGSVQCTKIQPSLDESSSACAFNNGKKKHILFIFFYLFLAPLEKKAQAVASELWRRGYLHVAL